jgi:RimJ/RimL family protein N-acetyltransferase
MRLEHRPLDLDGDVPTVHRWVTHERSVFWGMQGATEDEVRAAYAEIVASPHMDAWLGTCDGSPAFLAETYDPAHHELAAHHDARPGDLGMHFLVAPPEAPVHGFTRAVIRHVLEMCFADPAVRRVVVEPDARNIAVQRLNAEMGFVPHDEVKLHDKVALLSTCTREAFAASTGRRSA